MKKIALYVVPIAMAILLTGVIAQAQSYPVPPEGAVTTVQNLTGVLGIVTYIVKIVYYLFFALAVFFIIWAAFSYLTAGGDPTKVKTASHRLIYAIVAIAVALLAYGIQAIVRSSLTTTG